MLKEVLANDEHYDLVASKLEKHEEFPPKVNPSSGLTEEVGEINTLLDELLSKKEAKPIKIKALEKIEGDEIRRQASKGLGQRRRELTEPKNKEPRRSLSSRRKVGSSDDDESPN